MAQPQATVRPSSLRVRVISALVMAPVALLAVWAGGWPLALFTALAAVLMSLEWSRLAAPKRDAAPGVDGETWKQYGKELEARRQDLSARLKRGAYRARPVRRVWIAKADGRQRPLGVLRWKTRSSSVPSLRS